MEIVYFNFLIYCPSAHFFLFFSFFYTLNKEIGSTFLTSYKVRRHLKISDFSFHKYFLEYNWS